MLISKLGRTFTYSGWAAYTLARYGWPRKLIFYNSGIGDDLLCTIVARELRSRKSGRLWVGSKYGELFEGNPDAQAVPISDWRFGALAPFLGADVRPLWYTQYDPENDRDPEPPLHFAAMMCQKAEVSGLISIRPYIFLRHSEMGQGNIARNQIAIQSTTRAAATPLKNKEWLSERFQSVVNSLSGRFNIVQLGTSGDPKLDNVIDLRGKTSLREAAAILSQSRLFIGLAGGLMHLARAVDCPAVIVYGGRERPEISGYICNKNITTTPPCSPCWQRNRCDYDRVCMTSIDADLVLSAVGEILDRDRTELLTEQISI
jgi:ADP-heptose:LPS heptosyltransferase